MDLMLPKGTRDFLPEQMIERNRIIESIKQVFEEFGFSPLETPVFERMEILGAKFAAGAESEAVKETFKVIDQGDRNLGLKYDLTVPMCRLIGMNPRLKMPFKRYQIQKVYRDGPVTANRYREFLQCDVDVVGVKSVLADAEIISVAKTVFERIGINNISFRVNDRKLLNELMDFLKIDEAKKESVLVSIDKMDKLSESEVEKELRSKEIPQETINSLLEIVSIRGSNEEKMDFLRKKIGETEGLKEIAELLNYCSKFGAKIELDLGLARGLAYYTGPIFEVNLNDEAIKGSIAGGGRYDKMISGFLEGKEEFPATGISFGIERIFDYFEQKNSEKRKSVVELFVVPIGSAEKAIPLIQEFRKQGIKTDFDLMGKGISKNLEFADKNGIPFVVVLGDNEFKEKKFRLKNMKTGKEAKMKFTELKKAKELIKGKGNASNGKPAKKTKWF